MNHVKGFYIKALTAASDGLSNVETVPPIIPLFVSSPTFDGGRTSVLQGLAHLLLFAIYVMRFSAPKPHQ